MAEPEKKKRPSPIIAWILIGGGLYILISRLIYASKLEDSNAGDFVQAVAYSLIAIVFGLYLLRVGKKIKDSEESE